MTTFEIILTALTSTSLVGNVVQFFTLRSARKKAMAEATQANDAVLLKRIEFLDERVTRLEQLACYRKDCKDRV